MKRAEKLWALKLHMSDQPKGNIVPGTVEERIAVLEQLKREAILKAGLDPDEPMKRHITHKRRLGDPSIEE